ncbi:unannotated protein [freshwater metagenome]|uniref:Unannotated protein n=1 Tax=freshwater metagenome TaxID=449393 RepID=A0A6J5YX93_9ZZZZ|nr:hypothetical protein [Actinomycetota bacterium]
MPKLYSVEREYPVPISALWDAWMNPDALSAWYSPTDLSVLAGSVVSENKIGGWWTVGVDVTKYGFKAYFWGTYSELELNKKIVHSMNYSQDAEEFAARVVTADAHTIEIDFDDRGDSSWVRFTQFGELPADQAEGAKTGMESYFDNLGIYISR